MTIGVVQLVLAVSRTGVSGATYALHVFTAAAGLALVIYAAITSSRTA